MENVNAHAEMEPDSTEKASAEVDAALRAEGLSNPTPWERWEGLRLARLYTEGRRRWDEAVRLAAISVVGARRIMMRPSPYA
jgi:hypothetical protein